MATRDAPRSAREPADPWGMRFRETLWFKKKSVEEDEATVAQQVRAGEETANTLRPIEDRYSDDEIKVSREDSQVFGLHTGATSHIPRMPELVATANIGLPEVPPQLLAKELKRTRLRYSIAAVGALAVTIGAMFALT